MIAESIKADPQLSDREHAKRTGASPTTVGGVRNNLEASGEVSKLDTSIGSDGKSYPASKPREPEPAPEPEPEVEVDDRFISQDELDDLNARTRP